MKTISLDKFTALLTTLPAAVKRAEHHGLEQGAKLIEVEAKAELGVYQGEAGPFGAWPILAERTQEQRVKLGYTPDDPGLRSGEMRDSIKHSVGEHAAAVGSNDQNLVYFEHGTVKQPPRNVLGGAAFRKGADAAKAVGLAVGHALAGKDLP